MKFPDTGNAIVISDNVCKTAQTQLHTREYAMNMLPGPAEARDAPVPMKRPEPMFEPSEMICEVRQIF